MKNNFLKMKERLTAIAAIAIFAIVSLTACQDDVSKIGSTIAEGETSIIVDSTFNITGQSVYTPVFDSRSTSNLIGRINVPEYGSLQCSYVAQMMAASSLAIHDSIGVQRIDSMKLIINAVRGAITGDSLAPQQIKVYQLTKQLPADIDNRFDPTGYYSQTSLLGSRNYTLNALSMNDSIYAKSPTISIGVKMPLELARKIYNDYHTNPDIFQWPSTFNRYFPGIYVEPSFGRGCIANIINTQMVIYYNYRATGHVLNDEGVLVPKEKIVKDSTTVFATAPEVLNSNIVNLQVSQSIQDLVAQGKNVLLAPAGYNVRIKIPIKDVIEKYASDNFTLGVINNLTLTLPCSAIKNDYGIAVPPYLLMVKTNQLEEFFANNKLPDGINSFWAGYSAGGYTFTTLREYLAAMMKADIITEDDTDFTIVPVYIDSEVSNGVQTVSTCTPYIVRPTMCILNLDRAKLKFTYSKQLLD